MEKMPRWADIVLVPLICRFIALGLCGGLFLPALAQAEVVLACTFETIPVVVMTHPDGLDAVPKMQVAARPAVDMTVGQGSSRYESADVDGHHFRFSPSNLWMDVEKDGKFIVGEPGRCVTIGGPENGTPINLAPAMAETTASVPAEPAPEPIVSKGKWLVTQNKSQLDDSSTVVLSLTSENTIKGQFGDFGPAHLYVRCLENTTSVFVILNDMFLADIQGYGTVEFRIDSKKADKVRMQVSTDNKALGLWSGGSAIPFAKRLIDGEQIVMRATPFNESPIETTFALAGLAEAVKPLRSACNW